MTHIAAYLAIALALGAVACFSGLRSLERAMTYHPARLDAQHPPLSPSGAETVWLNSADGTRLHGWYFTAESSADTAAIIYFHGNGGNVTTEAWLGHSLSQRGFNVLVSDYRGYGLSDGVAADESELYLDGEAALRS